MDYLRLGQRIRRQRKLMGLTQKEVAERAGISLPFYGHIERGTRKASLETTVDIANALGYSKPSVTRAMSVLKKAGYVDQESYGTIRLTEAGRKRANEIYDRHVLIKEFLMTVLSLDAETAETDACRIEHIVSPLTIERMRALLREKR